MNRRLLWVLMFGTIVVIQGCAAGGSGSGGGANIPADNSGNVVSSRNFANPVRATTFGNAGRIGSVYEIGRAHV